MSRRRLTLAAVLVVSACVVPGGNEQELRTRIPGTWVGTTPDGVKLTLVLAEDGTGEVNGHPGTWEIKIGRILLSDGEHLVPCDLSGEELTCHTPEGDLVMTRGTAADLAAAPPPAPAEPARAFTPEKTVPGQPFIAPANGPIGGASFTAPDGWSHEGGKVAGNDVHVLKSAEVDGATITIGRVEHKTFGDGAARSNRHFLESEISKYTSSQHEVVLPSEDIDLAGQVAARAIFKHDVSEYYAATVGGKDVIFVIVARYPTDKADAIRPVVETVLASFRASP